MARSREEILQKRIEKAQRRQAIIASKNQFRPEDRQKSDASAVALENAAKSAIEIGGQDPAFASLPVSDQIKIAKSRDPQNLSSSVTGQALSSFQSPLDEARLERERIRLMTPEERKQYYSDAKQQFRQNEIAQREAFREAKPERVEKRGEKFEDTGRRALGRFFIGPKPENVEVGEQIGFAQSGLFRTADFAVREGLLRPISRIGVSAIEAGRAQAAENGEFYPESTPFERGVESLFEDRGDQLKSFQEVSRTISENVAENPVSTGFERKVLGPGLALAGAVFDVSDLVPGVGAAKKTVQEGVELAIKRGLKELVDVDNIDDAIKLIDDKFIKNVDGIDDLDAATKNELAQQVVNAKSEKDLGTFADNFTRVVDEEIALKRNLESAPIATGEALQEVEELNTALKTIDDEIARQLDDDVISESVRRSFQSNEVVEKIAKYDSEIAELQEAIDLIKRQADNGIYTRKAAGEQITRLSERIDGLRKLKETLPAAKSLDELNNITKQLSKIDNLIDNTLEDLSSGAISRKTADEALSNLRKEKAALRNLEAAIEAKAETLQFTNLIKAGLDSVDRSTILPSRRLVETKKNLLQSKLGYALDQRTPYLKFNPEKDVYPKNFADKIRLGLNDGLRSIGAQMERVLQRSEFLSDETNFVTANDLKTMAIANMDVVDSRYASSVSGILRRYAGSKKEARAVKSEIEEYMRAVQSKAVNEAKDAIEVDDAIRQGLGLQEASGMSTQEANKIIDSFTQKYGNVAPVQNVIKKIREYNDAKLLMLAEEGLIDFELLNKLKKTYPDYVPLYRNIDDVEKKRLVQSNKTNPTINSTVFELDGGVEDVLDVIDNSFYKGSKINRAVARNRVMQKMARFIEKSDDQFVKENFRINGLKDGQKIGEGKGIGKRPLYQGEVEFYSNGKRYTIQTLKDENLLSFWTDAPGQASRILNTAFGWYTNLKASVLTRFNPAFKIKSLMRDTVESMIVADAFGASGLGPIVDGRKALKGVRDFQRGIDTTEAKLYKEALENGIGFGKYSASLRTNYTSDLTKELQGGIKSIARKASEIGDTMDEYLENAVRFSHYINARKAGYTPQLAASIAADSGINFAKRGRWTSAFSGAYMFFNATMQGNFNLVKALRNPATFMKVAAGIGGATTAQQLANERFDEDWRDYFDDYILESNMIIILGKYINEDGEEEYDYLKYPVPIGLRPLWTLANKSVELKNGQVNIGQAVGAVTQSAIDVMHPTGGRAEFIGSTGGQDESREFLVAQLFGVTPEALRPVMQVIADQGHFGEKILLESFNMETGEFDIDESELDKPEVKAAMKASEIIRKVLGPIENTPAGRKFTDPGALLQLFNGYANFGAVKEAADLGKFIENSANPDKDADISDLPVAGDFFDKTKPRTYKFKSQARVAQELKSLADDPDAQNARYLEYLLENGEDGNILNQKKASYLRRDAGMPEGLNFNFSSGYADSAETYKLLSSRSDDVIDTPLSDNLDEKKESYINYLKRTNPTQYRYYTEYNAVEDGVLEMSDAEAIQYFTSRGIDMTGQTKNKGRELGADFRRSLERKAMNLKRLENPDAMAVYESFQDAKDLMEEDGQAPDVQVFQDLQNKHLMLYNEGYITQYDLGKKMQSTVQSYVKAVNTEFIDAFNEDVSNYRTPDELLAFITELSSQAEQMEDVQVMSRDEDGNVRIMTIGEFSLMDKDTTPPYRHLYQYLLDNGYINP